MVHVAKPGLARAPVWRGTARALRLPQISSRASTSTQPQRIAMPGLAAFGEADRAALNGSVPDLDDEIMTDALVITTSRRQGPAYPQAIDGRVMQESFAASARVS